jgi:hypothetical protein
MQSNGNQLGFFNFGLLFISLQKYESISLLVIFLVVLHFALNEFKSSDEHVRSQQQFKSQISKVRSQLHGL